jgi:hypothetical protein
MNSGNWRAAMSHTVVDPLPAGAETRSTNQLPVCDVERDREPTTVPDYPHVIDDRRCRLSPRRPAAGPQGPRLP